MLMLEMYMDKFEYRTKWKSDPDFSDLIQVNPKMEKESDNNLEIFYSNSYEY